MDTNVWNTVSLLLLVLEAASVSARFQREVCEIAEPSKAYPEPQDMPKIPDTFEVHVDCKITNKNKSTEIHEYYDYENNRGLLRQVQSGESFDLYYDYNTNEMLAIFPIEGICHADTLSTDENRFLFGYQDSGGRAHIFSPSGALHFQSDDQISGYLGPDTVRGIGVRKWYACQYVKEMDATVNVYWYFSDPNNWDTAVGYPEVPVRCQVKGVATDLHSYTHNFSHTYDFLHFKNFISTPEVFETPDGIVCPGRKNTKTMPALPQAFSLTMETVSPTSHEVAFLREWYDFQLKLVRLEYSPGPSQLLTYGPRMLTEIHDFSTGVAYIMDRELGNCTITPIERSQNGDVILSNNVSYVNLRTPQQIFYTDNAQPVYLGQKTVRGIPCDAWVTTRNLSTSSSTWQWCFRSDNWTSVEDGRSQNASASGTPVQMHLWLDGVQYEYNFYHVVRAEPDVLRYDVSSCFHAARRRKFDFAVPGRFAPAIQKNLRQFRVAVQNAVASVTRLSLLRIAEIQVVYLADVHIRVTLLDKPRVSGDVSQVTAQPELDAAADDLARVISANSLVIQEQGQGGQLGRMTVLPTSLVEYKENELTSRLPPGHTTQPATQPATRQPPGVSQGAQGNDGSDRYSAEAMGGLGFGTLSLGLILGTVTAFVYLRKTGRLEVHTS